MRKDEFEIAKPYLPTDWAVKISRAMVCSVRYVRMVSKGDRNNEAIDNLILFMAQEGKQKADKKLQEKKDVLDSLK